MSAAERLVELDASDPAPSWRALCATVENVTPYLGTPPQDAEPALFWPHATFSAHLAGIDRADGGEHE